MRMLTLMRRSTFTPEETQRIADALLRLMHMRDWTQSEAARHLGLSQQVVSRLMVQGIAGYRTAAAVAAHYGVTVEKLLSDPKIEPPVTEAADVQDEIRLAGRIPNSPDSAAGLAARLLHFVADQESLPRDLIERLVIAAVAEGFSGPIVARALEEGDGRVLAAVQVAWMVLDRDAKRRRLPPVPKEDAETK